MEIQPATNADIEEIVGLFKAYNFALTDAEWLRWKYFANPIGEAKMFKLLFKTKLVGAVAIIPQLFYFDGKPVIGLQTVDGLLGREIRGKGFFNEVMHFLATQRPDGAPEQSFYLSFPSLAVSVKAHENAGWHRLVDFQLRSALLNPEPVLRRKGLPLVGRLLAFPWRVLMGSLLLRGAGGITVHKAAAGMPDCNRFRAENKVAGDRSAAFMQWRVADNPRDRMIMLEFRKADALIGYAVCKFVKRSVEITEFRTTPGFTRKITAALLRYINAEQLADSVDFWFLGKESTQEEMPSLGLFNRYFTGALFINQFQRCGLPEAPDKWEISYLDSDW